MSVWAWVFSVIFEVLIGALGIIFAAGIVIGIFFEMKLKYDERVEEMKNKRIKAILDGLNDGVKQLRKDEN